MSCKLIRLPRPSDERLEFRTKELLGRCVEGSVADCEDVYRSLKALFTRTARRVAHEFGAPDDTDDLVQEIYLKLTGSRETITRLLPDDEGSAQGYLAILAANAARDWYRAKGAAKRGDAATRSLDDSTRNISRALGHAPSVERHILLQQIEEALEGDSHEKTVFRLFYRQGLAAREIADLPAVGLTAKGVESLLQRMGGRIKNKLGVGEGKTSKGASP